MSSLDPASHEERPLEELVADFLERRERESLAPEEFARAFPQREAALLDVLQGLQMVEGALEEFDAQTALAELGTLAVVGQARRRLERAREGGGGRKEPAQDDFIARVLASIPTRDSHAPPYRPEGEIARGGQGAVLAVWDEILQRRLAMKVALTSGGRADGSPPETRRALARFLEEAQVTAQLDHPGIVPVHELGLSVADEVYFTMKLVKGSDLRAVLERVATGAEGWTRTRAVNVLLKVCEAMAYAHAKGVVHRDLKPSNVMVGRYGEVYVMDWGLARVEGRSETKDVRIRMDTVEVRSSRHVEEGAGGEDSPLVTADGDVVGTPAFMPPEQAWGQLERMGPWSDVYSVGAILYQLLTGEVPYCPSGSRPSNHGVLKLVRAGPPAPVLERAPDSPPDLAAICAKAMARDPSARYRDMGELREDIRAHVEGRVVRAYESGSVAELRKWLQRNKALTVATVAAVLLSLSGLAGIGLVQAAGKREADTERRNVLQLSAAQELQELTQLAEVLWPPWPKHEKAYDAWLKRAAALVSGLEPSPDGLYVGHRARLAELEALASPYSPEEHKKARRSDPRYAQLRYAQGRLASLEAAQDVREGADFDPVPLEGPIVDAPWREIHREVILRIGSQRILFGEEALALALAELLISEHLGSLRPYDRAELYDTLAWALYGNGMDDDAIAVSERALEEAPFGHKEGFRARLNEFRELIRVGRVPEIEALRSEVAELERMLADRLVWSFGDQTSPWWHAQLQHLIGAIDAFSSEQTGLVRGLSPEHGWGVARRRKWAAEIEQRTIMGPEATQAWKSAIASISDQEACPPYRGLTLEPQLGLLPIGQDPESGLWEFAHPLAGRPPERGADGQLVFKEESGLVFVLLPGGTFTMGAQSHDPSKPHYDKQAIEGDGPVREVTLRPFFLSKYEMTQAQWLRMTGDNPSAYDPSSSWVADLTHPVEQVSWHSAYLLCKRMGLSLPTEAQWEYAARAGSSTVWWTGDKRDTLRGAVNLADASAKRAQVLWSAIDDWPQLDDGYVVHAPVDELRANGFGFHHMVGNVWEWCLDPWDSCYHDRCSSEDPIGLGWSRREHENPSIVQHPSRSLRGSSYNDAANVGRSSFRTSGAAVTPGFDGGLRPGRELLDLD